MQEVVTDKTTLANIAANVARLRNGKSYSQLARDVTIAEDRAYPATIERIEKGQHMPGAGLLKRLAEALGTTADALMESPSPSPRKNLSRAS